MSKARELAELGAVYDSGALSNRNIIINGEMKLAQRGTSFSTSTSTIYTLDRFQSATGSSFNFDLTLTQSTDSPTGFSNSLKITPDSTQTPSGSDNGAIRYNIEAQDLQSLGYGSSDAKKMTLSFYVKSNKTGTYSLQLIGYDGQGTCLVGYTIDASNTWERKTITIDPDTSNAFANDNTLGILIAWQIAGGADDVRTPTSSWALSDTGFRIVSGQVNFMDSTSNEWYLTGVQLEVGTEATPFEHRSFGDELERCQRYFYKESYSGNYGPYFTQYIGSHRFVHIFHPTTMRATPTSTAGYSSTSGSEYNSSSRHFKAYLTESSTSSTQHHLTSYQADAEL